MFIVPEHSYKYSDDKDGDEVVLKPASKDKDDEGIQEMLTYVNVYYEGSYFPGLITTLKKYKIRYCILPN